MPWLTRENPYGPWTEHFAWFPVRTRSRRLVWLKTIERRLVWNGVVGSTGGEFWWEYR